MKMNLNLSMFSIEQYMTPLPQNRLLHIILWHAPKIQLKIYFWAFLPLIDSSVKSGTGNEREKRWGVDKRKDIRSDSNLCPPWASISNVVRATACGQGYPPLSFSILISTKFKVKNKGHSNNRCPANILSLPLH